MLPDDNLNIKLKNICMNTFMLIKIIVNCNSKHDNKFIFEQKKHLNKRIKTKKYFLQRKKLRKQMKIQKDLLRKKKEEKKKEKKKKKKRDLTVWKN